MLYDAINYSAQVNEKTKKYRKIRKQNPNFKETTEEFLSGLHPDDRLVPVITVTIYFGNDGWDAAKSLQEMFSETDESLKEFLPDYKLQDVYKRQLLAHHLLVRKGMYVFHLMSVLFLPVLQSFL